MTGAEDRVDRLGDAVVRLVSVAENQTRILNGHTKLLRAHQKMMGILIANQEELRRDVQDGQKIVVAVARKLDLLHDDSLF